MTEEGFKALSSHERALVALAVLLDGREAESYLESDHQRGQILGKAAAELAAHPPELRMPYVATLLRAALEKAGR